MGMSIKEIRDAITAQSLEDRFSATCVDLLMVCTKNVIDSIESFKDEGEEFVLDNVVHERASKILTYSVDVAELENDGLVEIESDSWTFGVGAFCPTFIKVKDDDGFLLIPTIYKILARLNIAKDGREIIKVMKTGKGQVI